MLKEWRRCPCPIRVAVRTLGACAGWIEKESFGHWEATPPGGPSVLDNLKKETVEKGNPLRTGQYYH
jgi:hypothetical protein